MDKQSWRTLQVDPGLGQRSASAWPGQQLSLANVADGDDGRFEKSHGVSPLSAEDLLLTSSQAERLRRVETATRGGERQDSLQDENTKQPPD